VILAAAVAIVAAVVLLALAVPALLSRQLERSLDTSLRARAGDVARLAASSPDLVTQRGALEGAGLLVQVVDRRGRLVARSGTLGIRVLPLDGPGRMALEGRRASAGDGTLGAEPIRLYAAPLGELGASDAAGGAVLVAGSTAETEATLNDTRRLVLLVALVAAALGAALAAVLTRTALRPLTRLSSGARDIAATGDAARRLPTPPATDEVGELAATLNAMLASLERAREAERRFVGDASHELRTPLTALRGNVAYARRHGPDDEVLADIDDGVRRLGGLLDDLLALAREDAATPAHAEVVDLVEAAREAAATDPREATTVEGDAGAALVRGERGALERAVGNLVANARRHGPPGGRITITVRAAGDRALLTVADEGAGLSAADAEQAFERFWRGPGARGDGSGLGLAIVRSIAQRHRGSVSVDGARFTLDLPRAGERDGAHGSLKDRA
jgi:two-component system, OmpR family, sensor kinase